MSFIPLERFNLNSFWEKTPTPLKYILVFAILVSISYFIFSKKVYDTQVLELTKMEQGIELTYNLINNFEVFKVEQAQYNKEVINQLNNLHVLIRELNTSVNRKIDMILNSGDQNVELILERIMILNESFEKLSGAYAPRENNTTINQEEVQLKIGVRNKNDTIKDE